MHVPFCQNKCPYCNFYSVPADDYLMDAYTHILCQNLSVWASVLDRHADTLYLGGGTPSVLGPRRLDRIVTHARKVFSMDSSAEITVEVNPAFMLGSSFSVLKAAGVNRLSIGLQSTHDVELRLLGRLHTAEIAEHTIASAQNAGVNNISLDLMLNIQKQTLDSLQKSIEFCRDSGVSHVSAYLLKIEKGTAYYARRGSLLIGDEEHERELYLYACKKLEDCGFAQYEISNFAKPGYESRHNLKYWNCDEYIGIGPSAHSFIDNKRFYYGKNLNKFLSNPESIGDGPGGSPLEYSMLRLRLTEGLTCSGFYNRFGYDIPQIYYQNAQKYQPYGLVKCTGDAICLTKEGFLVSNILIAKILDL